MLTKLIDAYVMLTNRVEFGFRNMGNPMRLLQFGVLCAGVLKIFKVDTSKSILIPSIGMILILLFSLALSKTKLQAKQLKYDSEKNAAWNDLVERVKRIEYKLDQFLDN